MIDPLELADSGIFQCFATNDAGETNGATWLRVVSKCACTFHFEKDDLYGRRSIIKGLFQEHVDLLVFKYSVCLYLVLRTGIYY